MKILAENRFSSYTVEYIVEINDEEIRVLNHLLERSAIHVVGKDGLVYKRETYDLKPGDIIPSEDIANAGKKIEEMMGASREIRQSLKNLKAATTRVENVLLEKGGAS